MNVFENVAVGDVKVTPALACLRADKEFLIKSILCQVYEGTTALHVAAAGHHVKLVDALLENGANVQAANRRGQQALHYASKGPRDAKAQAAVVERLLAAGANPNAPDKNGVTPLHKAIRGRSSGAVKALLAGGADPKLKNKSGSTPLKLAKLTTGASGSGTPEAKAAQAEILTLLAKAVPESRET